MFSYHKWNDFKRIFRFDTTEALEVQHGFICGIMYILIDVMSLAKVTKPLVAYEIRINILKIIILATASSSLFQSYPNLKNTNTCDKYVEEILFTGGLNTIIEIILECRTLEVSAGSRHASDTDDDTVKENVHIYFDRGNKLLDRLLSLSVIFILNTLPTY